MIALLTAQKNDSIDSFQEFNTELNKIIPTISSEEELIEKQLKLKEIILDQFEDKCLVKDPVFIKPFINSLEKKFNILIESKVKQFKDDLKKRNDLTLNKTKQRYLNAMNGLFTDNKFHSNEELKSFSDNLRNKLSVDFKENFSSNRKKFGSTD